MDCLHFRLVSSKGFSKSIPFTVSGDCARIPLPSRLSAVHLLPERRYGGCAAASLKHLAKLKFEHLTFCFLFLVCHIFAIDKGG